MTSTLTHVRAAPAVVPAGSDAAGTPRTVWILAAAVFVAHLAVVAWGPYGPHRDALLYYAMGEHLRLFAMDAPPFIALVARATTVFGNIELLTHVPVAAAHAALIVLAAAFAARAGGGAGARVLAGLAVATAPIFLRAGSLFQPVVFDQLWWTLALWLLAGIGLAPGTATPRRWLLLGVTLGLGLLTKFTILVLGAGILLAIVSTPLRRHLATPWPWLAAALALVVGSPSVVGQVVLGWPFLGQYTDLEASQLARLTPLSFVLEQALMVGPVVVLAAAGGVVLALRGGGAAGGDVGGGDAGIRAVARAAAAAFVLMLLAGGKAYYIAPIWPALLGIALGRTDVWLRRRPVAPAAARATRAALWAVVAAYGAVTLPLGLPFLPPEPMARYAAGLGVEGVVTTNTGDRISLPQDYADMLGWDDLAAEVAAVWRALPDEDRERAVILATNYGRAGAVDWFGGDDLPLAVAPIGSYWFWGPGPLPGEVVVVVGEEAAALEGSYFREAVEATRVRRPWGVPEERDVPVVVARRPLATLQEAWPGFRGRN